MLNVKPSINQKLELLQKRTITIESACKLTGLCYSTFYSKVKELKLSHARFGKKILFKYSVIIDFIKQHKASNWDNVTDEMRIITGYKCDLKKFSEQTGICYQTLYSKVKDWQIPHFRFGHKIIVSRAIMSKYINFSEEF